MDALAAGSLLSFLAAVLDRRSRHGRRHPLTAILGLVCCTIICGARSYAAIARWGYDQDIDLKHRLGFTRKPPKLGGFRKVLIALAPNAFEDALSWWAESFVTAESSRVRAGEALPGTTEVLESASGDRRPWKMANPRAVSPGWC
jgi:DDE family transposase